jgi:hypothetical protein
MMRTHTNLLTAVALATLVIGAMAGCSVAGQIIYTTDNVPAVAKADDLKLTKTVSQHGVTWTFERPVRVGQFVNDDYYVVGPVTVVTIDPAPTEERNGSVLNLKPTGRTGFDSRYGRRYSARLRANLPIAMKPGDSLVSSISCEKRKQFRQILWPFKPEKGMSKSWVRSLSVLTCMAAPQPADAFRPAFSDRKNTVYLARNLRRDLLPKLKPVEGTPRPLEFAKHFQRCWVDVMTLNYAAPAEYAPQYGRETARAAGLASLILMCDFPETEKETLLINFVQHGIDTYGTLRAGFPGWGTLGGHGQGRKWPLVFAGIMLGDEAMARPGKTFPKIVFQQDNQTVYAKGWTGANVVWAGHLGKTGWSKWPNEDRRGFLAEVVHPSKWPDDGKGTKFSNPGRTAENYRRCCTSHAWIAQALSGRIMRAEKIWDHDAFFDYCDRWMTEDDNEHIKVLQKAMGKEITPMNRQGRTWDPWVDAMYKKYRNSLPAGKMITFPQAEKKSAAK